MLKRLAYTVMLCFRSAVEYSDAQNPPPCTTPSSTVYCENCGYGDCWASSDFSYTVYGQIMETWCNYVNGGWCNDLDYSRCYTESSITTSVDCNGYMVATTAYICCESW